MRGAGLRLEAGEPFGLAQVCCTVVNSGFGRAARTGSEQHPAVARQRSAQPQAQALAWGSALTRPPCDGARERATVVVRVRGRS